MIVLAFLVLLTLPNVARGATYYISPTGSNSNNGQTSATPWLTFTYAWANTSCGDVLLLLDGTYGDGTSTGKIDLNGRVCAQGNEFTIQAFNRRQAKIFDNGTGYAVRLRLSAYIAIDGLYARSTDNEYRAADDAELGELFFVQGTHHLTLRNNIAVNPNRHGNNSVYSIGYHSSGGTITKSTDILLEDNEAYIFHRHCVTGGSVERMVVRRQYCNPRGGRIAGGITGGTIGYGDAVFSCYPCKDAVLENSIADGTTHGTFLNEVNASYAQSVAASNVKLLGNICYRCLNGNGVYINSRNTTGINNTPQNITVRDNAFVDFRSGSAGIRISDCAGTDGCIVDHNTIMGNGAISGARGISTDDPASTGVSAASNKVTITNTLVTNLPGIGFSVSGFGTWSGDELISNGNTTAFSPTPPANWTNTSTAAHLMGACKLWVPTGALGKGAGTGGSDIGATILYRYVDGVLTTTPLWDPITGAFPYGAADPDGVNRVAGQSLFDFHQRVLDLVNCPFPAGYGSGGGGTPSTVVRGTQASSDTSTTATPLTWNHTISASQDRLLVCVGLWHSGFNVGSVSSIDVSGQAMSLVKRQATAPDAYRAVEMWELANPTAGLRTITATLTGNISGALGRSTEFDGTSALNTAVSASTSGAQTSLSVTAPTNTNERVEDCTVSSKSVTYTHGADQTGDPDLDHSTQSLKLATGTQNGSDSGVMSNATGGTVLQAKVAVSLIPGTPDPPSGATLTQTDVLLLYPLGSEAGAPPLRSWLTDANAKNLASPVAYNATLRMRAKITGGVAATSPFGAALYCRKNAEAYSRVMVALGSHVLRFYGAGSEVTNPQVPAHLTPTSNRLCSANCKPGAILRADDIFTVSALNPGESVELDAVVKLEAPGDTTSIDCRFQKDNGDVFNTYTNVMHVDVGASAAGMGH